MEQVTADSEVRLIAQYLIRLHGSEARYNAILRSERARLEGDFVGYKIWKTVGTEVRILERQRAGGGDPAQKGAQHREFGKG